MVQWVSHFSEFTFHTLVFPNLLIRVIWVKDGRGCRSALLLLWSSLFRGFSRWLLSGGLRRRRSSFLLNRSILGSKGQTMRLNVLHNVPLLNVVLWSTSWHLWGEHTVGAQPPACSWGYFKLRHFRRHCCIETSSSCRKLTEGECSHVRSLLLSRETNESHTVYVIDLFMAIIYARLKHVWFNLIDYNSF